MGSLSPQQQAIGSGMCIASRLRPIKLHTHLDEPFNGSRGLLYQDAHRCFVAESGAGSYGILKM
jgi:hypothetical protein